jgi:hypothetical protein
VASLVLWLLCLVGYVAVLLLGHVLGDSGCEEPAGSSNTGHATWQWWPPGTSCTYDGAEIPGYGSVTAHTDPPSDASAVAVVVLFAWPVGTLVVARKLKHRRSPSHPAAVPTGTH